MKKGTKKIKSTQVGSSGPEKALVYKVTAKVLGKTYEQTGSTVSEALNKFDVRNVKGVRSIITVEYDGRKKDRILQPMQTNRLFNSYGLTKEIQIKNVSILFQGL
jgi:hypothetical protein